MASVRRVGRPTLNRSQPAMTAASAIPAPLGPTRTGPRQTGGGGPPRGSPRGPHRAIEHRDDQEDEQGVAQRGVLEEQLIARQRDRRRGNQPQPARAPAAAYRAEQERRGEQSERVLDDRDEQQVRRDRMQHAQEHRVADRPDRVRPQRFHRVLEVDARVRVADDGRAPNERQPDAQGKPDREQRQQDPQHAVVREPPGPARQVRP